MCRPSLWWLISPIANWIRMLSKGPPVDGVRLLAFITRCARHFGVVGRMGAQAPTFG